MHRGSVGAGQDGSVRVQEGQERQVGQLRGGISAANWEGVHGCATRLILSEQQLAAGRALDAELLQLTNL